MKKIGFYTLLCVLTLVLVFALCSCKGEGEEWLDVEFNTEGELLTTDMTIEQLRALSKVGCIDDEGKREEIDDYELSVELHEGNCTLTYSYKEDSLMLICYFFDSTKLSREGDYLFYEREGEQFLVRYYGTATELVLPERDGGYALFDFLFSKNKTLESIDIGDSVTGIGEYAFSGCTALSSLELGTALTKICMGAFTECISLTYVNIDTLTDWLEIDLDMPKGYASVLTFGFVGTNTEAALGAVSGNLSLGTIEGSDVTQKIEYVPLYVETCSSENLYDKKNASNRPTQITVGEQTYATFIEDGYFAYEDESGTKVKDRPLTVTNPLYFANSLHIGTEKLVNVVIPEEITEIKGNAFAYSDIQSVTVHSDVHTIGRQAFAACTSLRGATFDCDALEKVDQSAFAEVESVVLHEIDGVYYLPVRENPTHTLLFVRTSGTTKRARIDSQTVRIMPSALKGYELLSIPASVSFIGAGNLPSDEIKLDLLAFDLTEGWYCVNSKGERIELVLSESGKNIDYVKLAWLREIGE